MQYFQLKYGTGGISDLALQIKKYLHVHKKFLFVCPTDKSDLRSSIKFSKHIWFNAKQSFYVLDVALNSEKL